MTSIPRSIGRTLAALLALALYLAYAIPALAAPGNHHTYEITVETGHNVCELKLNDTKLYYADPGKEVPGVFYIDTESMSTSDMVSTIPADPQYIDVSSDGTKAYVMDYRATELNVIDLAAGTISSTISELPKYPTDMVYVESASTIYVSNSKSTVYPINLENGTVGAPVKLSAEKYPSSSDMALDPTRGRLWMAIGKTGNLLAFDTATGAAADVDVPISSLEFDGQAVGGRPKRILVDAVHDLLYVNVQAGFKDDWDDEKSDKLIILRLSDLQPVAGLLRTGYRAVSMELNPVTGEVYILNRDNTISIIDPESWTVGETVDFTALGVTPDRGNYSASVDVCGIEVNPAGDTLYVSHPYYGESKGSRVSRLTRNGDVPVFTEPQPVEATEPPPMIEEWPGPEQVTPPTNTTCPVPATSGTLTWGINDYMAAWETTELGTTTKETGPTFTFSSPNGWFNDRTSSADLSWPDGWRITHYPGIVPQLKTWFGAPELKINGDGTGTLSFAVAWQIPTDSGLETSEGFTRVTVATFPSANIVREGQKVTITATPDYVGRPYPNGGAKAKDSFPAEFIDFLHPEMRAWWYSTGAQGDPAKVPSEFTAEIMLGEEPESCPAQPEPEPTEEPTMEPTEEPTAEPTGEPTEEPTIEPTEEPTVEPTGEPTEEPTMEPTEEPTVEPTTEPTSEPTTGPSVDPTDEPSAGPTDEPIVGPSDEPIVGPSDEPSMAPTAEPTDEPTQPAIPTTDPSDDPGMPGADPSDKPAPSDPKTPSHPTKPPHPPTAMKPTNPPTSQMPKTGSETSGMAAAAFALLAIGGTLIWRRYADR